ncbi:unnamed protein product [Discula destructiva]
MTPLYWPKGRIDVDIVVVTGWNGKPFWSWKPESSRHMWLRDWLGNDLAESGCPARIFTYGYRAPVVASSNNASYHDYGENLLASLVDIRQGRQPAPLILIGHSLGGILIKQALMLAHRSANSAKRDIFESCVGLFMFGVPNLGLDNSALVTMTMGRQNEPFVRELGNDSLQLPELTRNFAAAFVAHNVKAFAIYERLDSHSVEKKNGRWSRAGPLIRMVTEHSACSLGVPAECVPSMTNHSNLVKFSSRDVGTYQVVLREMTKVVNDVDKGASRSTVRIPT